MQDIQSVSETLNQEEHVSECKGYEKPKLIRYGDVRDITLGGSIPGSESLGGCIDGLEPCS